MEFVHAPIMLNECLEGLNIKQNGIYVDGTMGGAGHSSQIVKKLTTGKLVGFDKDVEALTVCKQRLKAFNNVLYVNNDFKEFKNELLKLNIEKVDGILLDLGVSSYQLDNPERGFSFRFDARLDMRMNKSQTLDAHFVVNNYPYEKLVKILFMYGEEQNAKLIAKNIVAERQKGAIETTKQLVKIIENSVPTKYKFGHIHPATKTFQALRIEVNSELDKLEDALKDMVEMLNPQGRLCIITFHSLEDRIAKSVFAELATDCICSKKLPVCVCNHKAIIKLINKKPVVASSEEQKENPRSTCAKLRIIEKI